MNRLTRLLLGCSLALAAGVCCAAQPQANQPIPAASFSQFQCTGFIADQRLPDSIRVTNGADNDPYEELHTFTPGALVYLRGEDHSFRVGEAFSLVRPENGFFLNPKWLPGMISNQVLPFASGYKHQRLAIERLGRPYDNVGLVRVVRVTPKAAIAQVEFACTAINPQDIAVPYVPEPIPEYVPGAKLDRYAPSDGKLQGTIVGAGHAATFLAYGSIAYLNIGHEEGVQPGQRYRIYAVSRDNVLKGLDTFHQALDSPRETVGELVILHVQGKSSEAIVVRSLREIAVGDGIELE
ncbi:MAG: hypothetical protein ACRD3D_15240 [Terriglobia bacterium]